MFRSDPLTPARMMLTNLVTQETITVMFNPTEFEHGISVNRQRFTIPGLSHQPKHYVNTENPTFGLTFFYRALSPADLEEMQSKMRFVQSLAYPVDADTVIAGGTPRILFVWPKTVSMVCDVSSVSERYRKFNREGDPVVAEQRVEIEEVRDVRLLSRQVREAGLLRSKRRRSS